MQKAMKKRTKTQNISNFPFWRETQTSCLCDLTIIEPHLLALTFKLPIPPRRLMERQNLRILTLDFRCYRFPSFLYFCAELKSAHYRFLYTVICSKLSASTKPNYSPLCTFSTYNFFNIQYAPNIQLTTESM